MLAILIAAGWPVIPLLLASVLGLALVLERLMALRRASVLPAGLPEQVLQMVRREQDSPEALARLEAGSPLGRVLAEVVRSRHLPRAELRLAVEDAGRAEAHRLNRYLPALGTIAVVAPLLGLFGTVIGMIEIFGAYQPEGSDPAQLARGISIALYNTAFGILIAVPAMVFHRHLRTRVDGFLRDMEAAAARLARLLARPERPA
ncbi:MotA/TolQ/ExbB proton channel family protein [Orrella sp. JC864]|uniref:MotA/TolQ/ExbB proton channel family protein n=1 Tax=Orrella sp. JC864 TaxID=3120298 RepID=UPI0030098955